MVTGVSTNVSAEQVKKLMEGIEVSDKSEGTLDELLWAETFEIVLSKDGTWMILAYFGEENLDGICYRASVVRGKLFIKPD